MKVKVTRNYQITIPSEIRRKVGINIGDLLIMTYDEKRDEIIIKKAEERRKIGRKLTPEGIEDFIERGSSYTIRLRTVFTTKKPRTF